MTQTQISKEKAVAILQGLADEAVHLRGQPRDYLPLHLWWQQSQRILDSILGPSVVSAFKAITFVPDKTPDKPLITKAQYDAAYHQGLTQAETLLKEQIAEVQKSWPD